MLKRTDYAEKRQFGRRQTYIHAWVRVSGRPAISCIVRDLSQGGALLEFDEDVWLPYSFRVTSVDKQIDRVCEVRHETANRVGVEFVAHEQTFPAEAVYSLEEAASWIGQDRAPARR